MTNNNTKETMFEVLNCLNDEEITIVVIIWFVIQVFGNGMLLGLIQYDRFGNDPLKRRINDQVRFQKYRVDYSKFPIDFGLYYSGLRGHTNLTPYVVDTYTTK